MYNRYAPFFSGGGYCSEATSIVFGLKDVMPVQIIQHGDQVNFDYMIGLPKVEKDTLEELSCNKVAVAQSIAVCHSTPYAWNPSPWESELCPPNETTIGQAAYTIGRTMFETDRCARQNVCTVSRARLSCGFWCFSVYAVRSVATCAGSLQTGKLSSTKWTKFGMFPGGHYLINQSMRTYEYTLPQLFLVRDTRGNQNHKLRVGMLNVEPCKWHFPFVIVIQQLSYRNHHEKIRNSFSVQMKI